MIALVHGPDAGLARAEVAKLVATHDPAGANTSHLDGRDVSAAKVVAAVGSVGFFGGRRVVVVHDLMARATRASRAGAGDGDEAEAPAAPALDLAPLFSAVPDDNLLVLVDAALASVPAAVKKAAPVGTMVIGAEPPRGHHLVRWLATVAREAGGEIDGRAARLLVETLYPQTWSAKPANPRYDRPPDTELLRNEIAKLVLAAHPDPVGPEHVRTLVAGVPDDRIFRFVEAAERGHLAAALPELARLLDAGEEAAKLAAQVSQQIELRAVLAAGQGIDATAIGRALGLSNPNRMAGIASSGRGRTEAQAARSVAVALGADRGLKRGRYRQPEDALYELLTGVADDRRGGR